MATYLVTPRLMARYGSRLVLAAGLLALGLPALAGLASVPWLPGSRSQARGSTARADGIVATLRNPALVRPAVTFSATTMAVGIVVTFVPLAVRRPEADIAALALLVQPAAAIAGRWLAGCFRWCRCRRPWPLPGVAARGGCVAPEHAPGPFGIMPLIFRAGSAGSDPRQLLSSALAILGFADTGCQGGAAAFPDSFNAGSLSNGSGWPSPGAGHPLGIRRPLSWLSWSSHHPTSGTRRGLERDEP